MLINSQEIFVLQMVSQQELPEEPFIKKITTKPKLVKDIIMKEYFEYCMGGVKVNHQNNF